MKLLNIHEQRKQRNPVIHHDNYWQRVTSKNASEHVFWCMVVRKVKLGLLDTNWKWPREMVSLMLPQIFHPYSAWGKLRWYSVVVWGLLRAQWWDVCLWQVAWFWGRIRGKESESWIMGASLEWGWEFCGVVIGGQLGSFGDEWWTICEVCEGVFFVA